MQHYQFFSLSLFPSQPLPLISLSMCLSQTMYQQADTGKKNNNNSGAGINLNTLTPLNQPMIWFLYSFMANPAGACPTSSAGLWHQHQHFKGKGAFRATEREVGDAGGKAGGRLIQRAEVWINMPSFLAHTVTQGCLESGKASLNFDKLC